MAKQFDFNKLTQREKNLIGMLLVVASLTPFFIQTLPAWREYNSSKNQIATDKVRLQTLGSKIKKLEGLKDENKELSKKIESQKKFLAKSYELDFLAQDLKSICDDSSISLESFTPSTAEPVNIILEEQLESELQTTRSSSSKELRKKFKDQDLPVDLYRMPIEVRVKGNFTDVLDLFKKLEKYGRVISIENISIGKVESKKSSNRLSKSQPINETGPTASLFSSFDLVAFSLPKDDETLPFQNLERSAKSTFTYKKKKKR